MRSDTSGRTSESPGVARLARGGLPDLVRQEQDHAYAYYTLTLKNIYGALPLANKFKEYHCGRGIYETTIEYLTAFPVDFGLVDACLSADGLSGYSPTLHRMKPTPSSAAPTW